MDQVLEKSFAFSFSRLKAFEDCPRRYYETSVLKNKWPEEKSSMLVWGDEVHAAMAHALRTGNPLPTKFHIYQHWVDDLLEEPGELLVEDDCQWAINKHLKPTPWFAKDVWMRAIADAIVLNPQKALVIDWKTGKSLNGDPVQLIMTSLMLFCHFPKLQTIEAKFIWLTENEETVLEIKKKRDVIIQWTELLPRVKRLEKGTRYNKFPPQPGRFCRSWCPVKSCEYHGK